MEKKQTGSKHIVPHNFRGTEGKRETDTTKENDFNTQRDERRETQIM
jgi:hypothetical protein